MPRTTLIAALAGLALSSGADAAIVSFTSRTAWEAAPSNPQLGLFAQPVSAVIVNEALDGGSAAANGISGGSGWNAWTATASGAGTVSEANGSVFAGPAGSSLMIAFGGSAFTGGPALLGVGIDVGFYDAAGNRKDGRVYVRLPNGSALVRSVTAAESFVGFWSSDASIPITGVQVQPLGTAASTWYVGMSGLSLATVPAPGAVTLLGAVAMMVGARRRRG